MRTSAQSVLTFKYTAEVESVLSQGDATRVWEWGCPKRGDADITVTPARKTGKTEEQQGLKTIKTNLS